MNTTDQAHTNGQAMIALDRYGNHVHGFEVAIVPTGKRGLLYGGKGCPLTGNQALDLMETMNNRGHEVMARTSSPYCTEYVTLNEMREIFASKPA